MWKSLARRAAALATLFVLCCWQSAAALTAEAYRQSLRESAAAQQQLLDETGAVLRDLPQAEWTELQIQQYLSAAIWVLHYGIVLHMEEQGQVPVTLGNLVADGYVASWPANPFNDFAPVIELAADEAFAPGEIVYQVCPAESYSGISRPAPKSFQLSINGPDLAFAEYGNAKPLAKNTWASLPAGALYMTGAFTESGKQL